MALRKMLGSAEHPAVIRLMRLIETQNAATLTRWAAMEAGEHMLPLTTKDDRLTKAVDTALAVAQGSAKLSTLKDAVKAARAAAQAVADDPVAQAAAKAVATACGTAYTPTNALGFVFYSAAAYAYHTAGLKASREVYDDLATAELERLGESLAAVCIADEKNPVRVDWGC